jgi:hypothetical protein
VTFCHSISTVPLKSRSFAGRRTMIRVRYGTSVATCVPSAANPSARPSRWNSSSTYPLRARSTYVEKNGYVSATSGAFGSPGTLPGIGPVTVGGGNVGGSSCARAGAPGTITSEAASETARNPARRQRRGDI